MRLLLTGADGFTGSHLSSAAKTASFEVFSLAGDLCDKENMRQQVEFIKPNYVIHLAGMSHVTDQEALAYYDVNLLGTLNLLTVLGDLECAPQKVILASTSNVYGNAMQCPISEETLPAPISHYAMSKLAMEYLARPYFESLPIVITRPFNYTGVGHSLNFVIPKIIDHFQKKANLIELGNIEVMREYNDVRDVCQVYLGLLFNGLASQTYNISSGRSYSLRQVIDLLQKLSGHVIQIQVNPHFLRPNEIVNLAGDPQKLENCLNTLSWRPLEDTLGWMLRSR